MKRIKKILLGLLLLVSTISLSQGFTMGNRVLMREVTTPSLPFPIYIDNGGVSANIGQSVNVNYPSTNNNDILLMQVFDEEEGNIINLPSGWTQIFSGSYGVGLGTWVYYWKRADGTETGSITVTAATDDSGIIAGIMYRFSGCITTGTPYEGHKFGTQSGGTNLVNLADINSLGNNRLAVGMFSVIGDLYSSMILNGWAEIDNSVTLIGNDGTFILTTKELATLGTNAGTITLNMSSSTRGVTEVVYLKAE